MEAGRPVVQRRWWTAANAISLGRAGLGIGVFAIAALGDDSTSTALTVVLAAALVASISLDGLDGWVARRQGNASAAGSYADVLGDRLTEYGGWIYLAAQDETWGLLILALAARNLVVDSVKATSAGLGHDLEIGVHVTGWRLAIVSSRLSRVAHNGLKAGALTLGLLTSLESWPAASLTSALLGLFLLLSLVRGAASLAELPHTLRHGRLGPPADLWIGFWAQAVLAAAVVAVVMAIVA